MNLPNSLIFIFSLLTLTIDVNASSSSLYAEENDLTLSIIDIASGSGTEIDDTDFRFEGLAFSSSLGSLFGLECRMVCSIWMIDRTTGDTLGERLGFVGNTLDEITYNSNTNTIIAVGSDSFSAGSFLLSFDPITGDSNFISDISNSTLYLDAITYNSIDNNLYGVDTRFDTLVSIDMTTFEQVTIGALGFNGIDNIAFDSSTDMLFGVDNDTNQLIQIDTISGLGIAIGPHNLSSDVTALTAVPIPAALWLFSSAIGILIFKARGKKLPTLSKNL